MKTNFVYLKRHALIIVMLTAAFAPELCAETYTMRAYYPSPVGIYTRVDVLRSVRYRPTNKDSLKNPRKGEVILNSEDGIFYFYDGSKWVPQNPQGCALIPSQIEDSDRGPVTLQTNFNKAVEHCRSLGQCWRIPSAEELSFFAGATPKATDNCLTTSTINFASCASGFCLMRVCIYMKTGALDAQNSRQGTHPEQVYYRCVK